MISIIPLHASVLAILFIYLSVRVIRIRRRERIALGDKGNVYLRRAMAVQANFAEYAPLALLLSAFVEMQGFSPSLVHTIGLILVAGRGIHAYGVSQENENYRFRVIGMSLTFLVIGLSSLILIGSYIAQQDARKPYPLSWEEQDVPVEGVTPAPGPADAIQG